MPAVSRAQFRKMFQLRKEGRITARQLRDFTEGVKYKSLPERVRKVVDRARRKRKGG